MPSRTFQCLLFTCLSLGLTSLQADTPPVIESKTNLTYARYADRELQLDLYRPKDAKGLVPAVVCIHGGGWFKGDRNSMTKLAQALAERGFVTVSISYRLSGEAKFPAAIQDCKAAVRWLRANAETYGVEPRAIGVTGLSAGGHLAALLATSGGTSELEGNGGNEALSSTVQACIAMGAQSDLEDERIQVLSRAPANPHYRPFLGGSFDDIPAVYAQASPLHHLDSKDPPLLFMAGELDDDSTHAVKMRAELEQKGISTGLLILPKAPHAFLGQPAAFATALERCSEFFHQHLDQP